jgi:hypothetical protein
MPTQRTAQAERTHTCIHAWGEIRTQVQRVGARMPLLSSKAHFCRISAVAYKHANPYWKHRARKLHLKKHKIMWRHSRMGWWNRQSVCIRDRAEQCPSAQTLLSFNIRQPGTEDGTEKIPETCISWVVGSSLGRDTAYPEHDCAGFFGTYKCWVIIFVSF